MLLVDSGVQVFVRDEKKYAVLFQSVVLPCQYTTVSYQTAVVQWVYKSYCRDRGLTSGTGGISRGYEKGMTASYLDCSDNSRTVRTVASISGSSVTLSEYYKNRDISIINKADLRIGEVQWGDSGVYICKVVISDDLEGQNEASVELLVLGELLDFVLCVLVEWVFVVAVALGSVLFLLLIGVCWCQCCPHSCCCYVSCWCCPDTCCCPRHCEYEHTLRNAQVCCVSAVPLHAVGVPYRVPSPQDQDSLRVLQYVEKQLAHFNPARRQRGREEGRRTARV
uniref:Immunoglobulin-like domain-containing receptor 2 n=1 Tax=Pundamilia nyererei TaxID=303518 RepID=A0A3B4ERT0_9CICH